ncbi:MAG: GrpB family protein, partial [Thermoplasmata archaeon]
MAPEGPIVIVSYDRRWPGGFHRIGTRLRAALDTVALRIDHVGSTSVVDLDAKPVIDIQVSVATLIPEAPYLGPLERLGLRFHPENPDRTKRFFLGPVGAQPTHVHV